MMMIVIDDDDDDDDDHESLLHSTYQTRDDSGEEAVNVTNMSSPLTREKRHIIVVQMDRNLRL